MSLAEALTKDRRLCVLRALDGSTERQANNFVLQSVLDEMGHAVSMDRVNSDLAWLEEQGLVRTEDVAGDLSVARLTSRGVDVAAGRTVLPGVKRPRPGD